MVLGVAKITALLYFSGDNPDVYQQVLILANFSGFTVIAKFLVTWQHVVRIFRTWVFYINGILVYRAVLFCSSGKLV